MRHTFATLALAAFALTAASRNETISSPDGKIVVTMGDDGGQPTYSIALDGATFLAPSPLGLVMNYADLSRDLAISHRTSSNFATSYQMQTLKQRNIESKGNAATITFQQGGKDAWQLMMVVTDSDVAFRYTIAQPDKEFYAAIVKEEKTGFAVAQGTTTFLCPQMKPMTGFAGTAPSYETNYVPDAPTGSNGWGDGFTFPCLFRNGNNGWMLISETGTTGDYCGCHLANKGGDNYQIAFPDAAELNSLGSTTPGVSLPFGTPWRTITLGKTLAPIMESTITWDVVSQQYAPHEAAKVRRDVRGAWSWIIGMDSSCNYDEQKRYIDFAASMGYESLLIDALWDTQIGRDKMAELVSYAKTKGVGIYLWYNSNGYWNHAPQGPRGIMCRAINRKHEMQWLQKIGVRGLKIDFFGGDKQPMMQLYEDILSDANDHGLDIIFHGCTLPRGWEKMYPNFVAAEAVRASENLHFGQGDCDNEAFAATFHPFCRNAVGSMDFGGSTLNKRYNADNSRGTTRRTSDVFALATAIMFQSPVQHFAMSPKGNDEAPSWALDFMKKVPTMWEDVKFIDGYPGKYCVMARYTAGKWYIVGINAADKPLDLNLDLAPFNIGNTYTLYSDDAKLNGSCREMKLNKKRTAKVTIPQNGGMVIM